MRIDSNGNFLQYILPEYFIDSPEWDASTRVKSTKSVYKVSDKTISIRCLRLCTFQSCGSARIIYLII